MQARGCFYRDFIRHILCRLSRLIKLIVRTDSGAPELSLNYAAIYESFIHLLNYFFKYLQVRDCFNKEMKPNLINIFDD